MNKAERIMIKNIGRISLAALGLLVMTATTSSAVETTYPGSMCVRWAGMEHPYLNVSAIGNTSSGWLYLDCPVPRQVSPYTSIRSGRVQVIDQSTSAGISCNLVSAFRGTNGLWYSWSSGNRYSYGYGSGVRTVYFPSVGGNYNAHAYYSCKVPPKNVGPSMIVSYGVNQY